MNRTALEERVRGYILETFLYTRPDYELTGSESLLANGIIDSMGVMELVEFLQTETGLVINDEEITEENLGSIDAIVDFAARQRVPAPPVLA